MLETPVRRAAMATQGFPGNPRGKADGPGRPRGFEDLTRRARELGRAGVVLGAAGLGRADLHAPGRARRIAASRWPCWPGCTTSGPPTRGSASCWRSSRAPTWWPTPTRPWPPTSGSCAAVTTAGPGCRATWSRSWPGPPRSPSRSGSPRRRDADFGRFRPWLETDRRAQAAGGGVPGPGSAARRGPVSAGPAAPLYDALLDEYEPGARSARPGRPVPGVAGAARPAGRDPIAEASAPGRATGSRAMRRSCGESTRSTGRRSSARRWRRRSASTSSAAGSTSTAHPFCTGIGPGDTRITTRYDEHQFGDAFFGILHEVGHGLYEQGLPAEHFGTPMGEAVSLGVHESQSRLWENAVGREPALLDLLVSPGPAGLPRGPARRHARRSSWPRSTTSRPA